MIDEMAKPHPNGENIILDEKNHLPKLN